MATKKSPPYGRLRDYDLGFDKYKDLAGKTARYPRRGNVGGLIYAVLGLSGEAGELANKLKKVLRGDKHTADLMTDIREELGDVLWYASQVAHELGVSLSSVARENLAKLEKRYPGSKSTGYRSDIRNRIPNPPFAEHS